VGDNLLDLSNTSTQVQGAIDDEQMELEELRKVLSSQRRRLDNLYYIKDADGNHIRFKLNWAQKNIYLGMWYFNLVLKARQLGVTTFSCIFGLDLCLFNSNTQALIVAHNKDEAEEFFHQKVKYAYDNLPVALQASVEADTKRTNRLRFSNGSSIRVATSGRSGTFQFVHISEFGKLCAKYPDKANEIVSGTLNAIHPGKIVIIESTAEGREGHFYDYSENAKQLQDKKAKLTALDPKFFFFAWWKNPLNYLDPEGVVLYEHNRQYFSDLKIRYGIKLTPGQKAWYVKKLNQLGQDLMWQEHPSIPEEAFYAAIEGSYFKEQLKKARLEQRITSVPWNENYLVNTWWDLGYNDVNAIWFTQDIGRELRLIDYYENSGEGLLHYINYLRDEKPYRYGSHTAPHDIMVHEYTTGKTRKKFAADQGFNFKVAPRTSKETQIEASRMFLGICYFDEEKCDQGLKCLESYRKEWDEKKGTYKKNPLHDWASNGADAFHTLSISHRFRPQVQNMRDSMLARRDRHAEKKNPKGWT
jgi:hypothetical protein